MKTTTALAFLIALLAAGLTPLPDPATDVRLPKVFSDHMVLQRDQPIPVFGTAEPGGEVTVMLGEAQATATVGEDGRWRAELPAMEAGGPFELTVAGADTLTFTDVLVGEVWVASGQSNMEWRLDQTDGTPRPPSPRRTTRRCGSSPSSTTSPPCR